MAPCVGRIEGDALVVGGRTSRVREQPLHGFRDAGRVTLLDHETIFPRMHEGVALTPPHVDDFVRHRVGVADGRDRVAVLHQEGHRAVAEVHLQAGARCAHARVAGDHQYARRRARRDGVDRSAQRGDAGAQRAAVVRRANVAPQVESAGNQRRGLLLFERVGGGGEEHTVDARAIETAQAVDGSGDAHRHAVFVVPGDGLLGPAIPAPVLARLSGDGRQRQAGRRHVGAVGSDADHVDSLRG